MKRQLICFVALLAVCSVVCQNDCNIVQRIQDIKSHRTPLRAVNLGSWFVLEGWMVPNLWSQNGCSQDQVQGQYQFERCVGQGRIQQVLQQHWSTFITEADFQKMAANGVNGVRVPIGWWSIYDTYGGANKAPLNYYVTPKNYTVGSLAYIDRMFQWAQKYSIAILLDMHAAPGCQNNEQDCSGENTPVVQYWDKYPANQDETVDSIGLYAQRYANHTALLGFCLLNEPMELTAIPAIQSYYKRAYTRIRSYVKNNPVIVINPLIGPFQYGTEPEWVNFMNPSQGYINVWTDLHYYECFGGMPFNKNDNQGYVNYAQYDRAAQIKQYNVVNPKPMVILEWSACGVTDDWGRRYTQAQINSYALATAGWSFWAWPNPWGGNTWSFQTALNEGWVDSNQMAQKCYGQEQDQALLA
eukprot:TRINITY_DN135_c0_g1_i1.p1 TRINITY_DN135_c0_g1~~TRINITY_DN135_c0_g1_i1.p1  ORF type:complete len:413 (-),score=85.83 TRINITY_DN135_c0_g1_i1:77-1315(-)